jgi:endoglucanase
VFSLDANLLMKMFRCGITVLLMITASICQAQTCTSTPIKGVNLAGPAFAPEILPGRLNWEYKFPNIAQLRYYKKVGFDSVRLSISWERTQPELFGPLEESYLSEINKFMQLADDVGLSVLLEIHNYARYRGAIIGSVSVPADAFYDIWTKLASVMKDHPSLLAYGLMNEPYNTGGLWNTVAQRGVDGIRKFDMSHYIYVSGDGFSSTSRWATFHPIPFVNDPLGKEIYEGHIYFDRNESGKYADLKPYITPSTLLTTKLAPFVEWLKKFKKQGVITEWGVPSRDPDWFDTANGFLQFADNQCLSTYVWGGGSRSPK